MKKGTVMWKHNPYMKVNSVISADWHDSFWLQKCDAFYHSGGSIYKQKYEQGKRELEFTKQKIKQQHEEDQEQQQVLRKQLERKVGSIIKCLTFISITVSGWLRGSRVCLSCAKLTRWADPDTFALKFQRAFLFVWIWCYFIGFGLSITEFGESTVLICL